MRIAYIAAGAANMYCGSCLHDNTLAAALQKMGHDVALIPTYTPMRTDAPSVSLDRVFRFQLGEVAGIVDRRLEHLLLSSTEEVGVRVGVVAEVLHFQIASDLPGISGNILPRDRPPRCERCWGVKDIWE